MRWFKEFFLANLAGRSYAVLQKAYAFAWITVILVPLLVVPTILNLTTGVSSHPYLVSAANMVLMLCASPGWLCCGREDITRLWRSSPYSSRCGSRSALS